LGICPSFESFGYKKDKNGVPLLSECRKNLFYYYETVQETRSTYRGFYNNVAGAQDGYINFWKKFYQKLGNNKYIIGIDPLNEPTDAYSNAFTLLNEFWLGNFDFV
jgi:hypothetical protein